MSARYEIQSNNEWIDLNTLSGITVGSEFQIVNVGSIVVYLTTSATEPATVNQGIPLTTVDKPYAQVKADWTTEKVWIRCSSNHSPGVVEVQEV